MGIYLTIMEINICTKYKLSFRYSMRKNLETEDGMENYLTIEELAVMLKLSKQTIRRYVLNRTIPFRKIRTAIRFRLSEIEKWISGGCADNFVISDNAVIGGEAEGGLFPETSGLQETDGGNKEIL
jgi:excisionase family DNA binding protein